MPAKRGVNALSRAHFISTAPLGADQRTCKRCQCPISGALHFYRGINEKSNTDNRVSMPYLGRTSFLRTTAVCKGIVSMVSMPYLGRTSFLQRSTYPKKQGSLMCQCPISGALHFYVQILINKYAGQKGVNALSRAHFISTRRKKIIDAMNCVSMPYLGRTSFLRRKTMIKGLNEAGVNALSRAHFISTREK